MHIPLIFFTNCKKYSVCYTGTSYLEEKMMASQVIILSPTQEESAKEHRRKRANSDVCTIIKRMKSGDAHGVNLKKRGQSNAVYDLRNTDELQELIRIILECAPGTCWETFMYKSPPETIPKAMEKAIKRPKKSMNHDGSNCIYGDKGQLNLHKI